MKRVGKKQAPQTHSEQEKTPVGDILRQVVKDADVNSAVFEKIETETVVQDSVSATVVTVPASLLKALKKTHADAVKKLEHALGGTVFLVRKRKSSGLVKGERRHRVGPTYKDYQEAVAKDLVAPYHVVDRRTLVREDGSRLEKIIVERRAQKELANKFVPMGIVFEHMFEKKALFQENYY